MKTLNWLRLVSLLTLAICNSSPLGAISITLSPLAPAATVGTPIPLNAIAAGAGTGPSGIVFGFELWGEITGSFATLVLLRI